MAIPVSRNASSSSSNAFPITGPDLHPPPPPSPPQDAAGVIDVDVTASFSSSSSSSSSSQSKSNSSCKRRFMKIINIIKTTLSMILILFSVIIISAAIVTKQTVATSSKYNVSPILALFIFWFSLCWLAIMEGGLNCIVGLQPIPFTSYKNTHRKTYLCTKISHKQDNIERFIVGRQYLDLMIVFLTSFMVSSIENANVLGLPQWINDIFLGSDLAVILCTIVFGQLIAQINCAHSMLDFINNYGMVFSTYIALCVEASGILHAVYFVQIIFTYIVEQYYNNKRNKSNNNNNNEAGSSSSSNSSSNNKDAVSSIRKGGSTTTAATTLNTSIDSCTTHNSSNSNSNSNSNNNSIIDSINNSDDDDYSSSSSIKDGAVINVEFVDVGVSSNNNKNINEEENLTTKNERPLWKRIFFWIRVIFSLSISIFAIAVFSTALINGNTTIRNDSIPVPVSFISLFILLIIGGFMEALQIALFAVKHLPKESIDSNPIAKRNCYYILGNNNNNDGNDDNAADENSSNNSSSSSSSRLQSFLVGRQIAQTVIMFMIARIITVEMKQPNTATLFGVSQQIQTIFFDSGLLNALVTTIFASLSWRVTANCFPMLYLGSPFSIWIIRLCLVVEGTGICDAAWTIAKIPAYFFIIKSDEEYLSLVAIEEQQEQEQQEQQQEQHQEQEKHQEVHSHSQECDNNVIIKDVESQLQSQSQSQSESQQQGM